jgi:prophage regulatory protein
LRNFDDRPDWALIRENDVLTLVPFGRSTLWHRCSSGDFPAPVRDQRITAWRLGDVRRYLAAWRTQGIDRELAGLPPPQRDRQDGEG